MNICYIHKKTKQMNYIKMDELYKGKTIMVKNRCIILW